MDDDAGCRRAGRTSVRVMDNGKNTLETHTSLWLLTSAAVHSMPALQVFELPVYELVQSTWYRTVTDGSIPVLGIKKDEGLSRRAWSLFLHYER